MPTSTQIRGVLPRDPLSLPPDGGKGELHPAACGQKLAAVPPAFDITHRKGDTVRLRPTGTPCGECPSTELEVKMARLSILMIPLACVFMLLVGGCQSSNPNNVSISAIRGNLTPEVRGTTETDYEIANNMAIVGNIQLREASDDLGRIFLFDQPSTLSPYPIIPTGRDP